MSHFIGLGIQGNLEVDINGDFKGDFNFLSRAWNLSEYELVLKLRKDISLRTHLSHAISTFKFKTLWSNCSISISELNRKSLKPVSNLFLEFFRLITFENLKQVSSCS